jgi:hypothetical protein
VSQRFEEITAPALMAVPEWQIADVVEPQVRTANYLLPPLELAVLPDRVYQDNATLWYDIIRERLRASVTVTLEGFLLFEWLPRAPGLFYTDEARWGREEAMHSILRAPPSAGLPDIDDAERTRRAEAAYERYDTQDYMYIFDPHGKANMLKGGIGCIRLKRKDLDDGRAWLMSASSSPVAHEGFPVAVPDHLYARTIDQIATEGAVPCTLTGTLRFLPDPVVSLFGTYPEVPQLYLLVEELRPEGTIARDRALLHVSVAVSFESAYEGEPRMYASYVTFYPGEAGSLQSRVRWLEEVYVKGMYQGRIVTNFDEHRTRFGRAFEGAVLDLEGVMNNGLDRGAVESWLRSVHIHGDVNMLFDGLDQLHVGRVERMEEVRMGDTYNLSGDFRGAILNIKSTLTGVTQTIGEMTSADEETKAALTALVDRLNEALQQAPPEVEEEAEAVAETAKALVEQAAADKPNKTMIRITGEGLKQAAQQVAAVMPTVVAIAAQIVGKVLAIAG